MCTISQIKKVSFCLKIEIFYKKRKRESKSKLDIWNYMPTLTSYVEYIFFSRCRIYTIEGKIIYCFSPIR